MNRNAKKRKRGQYAQGNTIYLSAYDKLTKSCVKLPLDYSLSDISLDSDNDKLIQIYSHQGLFVFAIYDTSRIAFVQVELVNLFDSETHKLKSIDMMSSVRSSRAPSNRPKV